MRRSANSSKTLSRRHLLGAGAAAFAALQLPRPAQAAEFTMKLGTDLPAIHPMNIRAGEAANRIREETGGRVNILLFPANQLGSDTDTLSQIRSGAMEMAVLPTATISTLIPGVDIASIGFAWKTYEDIWRAMDGELGTYTRAQIAKANIVTLEKIWNLGFRQITSSNKPITTPDDLHGFRIRVPVTQLWTDMFKALGAAPTNINFNEVYPALQTKVVDGQENPLSLILTAKFYEVQKFCTITNHLWTGQWTCINRRAWDRLPADLQAIVAKHINAAAMDERTDLAQLDPTAKAELAAKGLVFNEPDVTPFREFLAKSGFYNEWKHKFGEEAWSLLEKYAGKLS